ncbi:GTP-dependent dephospho-CoA kinase family protein [Halopelagius fulvigenes]|uniref:GTP-dependent dephospho-CoA kinase n=1 Tax=Halopelagius fulvigenes TaxID=1198324 RepID=A0ABD5TTS1_9EURY
MLRLPRDLRGAFKEPFGPVYRRADRLLDDAGDPIIAVGDVVTYHLREAGRVPDVAVVDGQTKREAIDEEIRRAIAAPDDGIDAANEAGTIGEELLTALATALAEYDDPVTIVVEGEEDLATLPAVVAAPLGASVVYGQPDEGMVLVSVTEEAKLEMRTLLRRMEGDADAALDVLGVEP